MALTVDPATKVFSVLQADLSFVSGTLWTFDTNVQRQAMMTLLASENYIWMDDPFIHATQVTVAGVTYARTLQLVNGYSITLENTGAAYSASFEGSNNDFFDIENSKLNPTPLVTVLSNNSAGLQTVISGSGLTAAEQAQLGRVEKFLRNRQYTNKTTGKVEQYNDAGSAIEFEAPIFSDDGTTPYDGTTGIERRNRFETP